MPSVAADSGSLYAIFDVSDRAHGPATAWLGAARRALVCNVPVLTEVTYPLRRSVSTQCAFLAFIGEALMIDSDTGHDLYRISELMAKYTDLPAEFAESSLVAMCERPGIELIATLDRDFEVYRKADGTALTNVLSPR